MKKASQIFFEEDVIKTADKKDGVFSILFFAYYMIIIFLFGMLVFKTNIYQSLSVYFSSKTFFRFIFYIPNVIVSLLPIFLILIFRRQSLDTIGLKKTKSWKSILLGIIGSIPFSVMNAMGPIRSGKTLNPNITDWIWIFLYYLVCIAFVEEVVFRGYLQTRIFGLIKNKWIGIVLVGIMFSLMHVPFQMIRANMSFVDFILYDMQHLITTMIIHIYLVYLYTRDNNIIAPTIAHAIMNFSYEIFI